MRIYTKIVFDFMTGELKGVDSFEYKGDVAYCGGGGKSPDIPPPAPPPKQSKDATAVSNEARQAQRDKAKKYAGFKSTILTGGLGLDEKAKVGTKTLLGR